MILSSKYQTASNLGEHTNLDLETSVSKNGAHVVSSRSSSPVSVVVESSFPPKKSLHSFQKIGWLTSPNKFTKWSYMSLNPPDAPKSVFAFPNIYTKKLKPL